MFPHPHNRYTIYNNINQTLKNFDLKNKQIVVVSLKLGKINRLHFLHGFVVHDILSNKDFSVFVNTIRKLKIIYKCFNSNTGNIIKIQNAFENELLINFLSEAKTKPCVELYMVNVISFSIVENSGFRKIIKPILKGLGNFAINKIQIREEIKKKHKKIV